MSNSYAKIRIALYNPLILDSGTRLDNVLITCLDSEWVVLDRTRNPTRCLFLEIPAATPCETMDEIKAALDYHRKGQGQGLDGTQLALMAWLSNRKHCSLLPDAIDLEPVRTRLVKRQREKDKKEAEARKKHKIVVVVVE